MSLTLDLIWCSGSRRYEFQHHSLYMKFSHSSFDITYLQGHSAIDLPLVALKWFFTLNLAFRNQATEILSFSLEKVKLCHKNRDRGKGQHYEKVPIKETNKWKDVIKGKTMKQSSWRESLRMKDSKRIKETDRSSNVQQATESASQQREEAVPSPAQRGNAHGRCGWSELLLTVHRCQFGLQSLQCVSQSPQQTAGPSWKKTKSMKQNSRPSSPFQGGTLRPLTEAELWSCEQGHQDESSCTPPPPSQWRGAGSGACSAALAACHGCGWSIAAQEEGLRW